MSADDWEDPDDYGFADDEPSGTEDGASEGSERGGGSLPVELQNWRVVEVEGTVVSYGEERWQPESSDVESSRANVGVGTALPASDDSGDHLDDGIVLSVPERAISIAPGIPGTLTLSLLNNADRPVVLQIGVKGDASPAWFPELPMGVPLQPGERQSFVVMVTPPPQVAAGEYALRMVVRQTDRPERYSSVGCRVTILRTTGFQIGMLQPERVSTSWWSPSARTELPVANLGNHEMHFRVIGADADRECVFEFDAPYGMFAQVGQASFALKAGARETVGVTILPKHRPAVGLIAQERPFRIAVEPIGDGGQPDRQVAQGTIVTKALIGPWQMAAAAFAAAAFLLVTVLSGAAMLVALRPAAAPPPIVVPTVAPAPAIALVLNMDKPVPTRESVSESAELPAAPAPEASSLTQATQNGAPTITENGLPVVQQNQVSAPGEAPAAPVANAGVPGPTPIAVAPVDPNAMTYAQMFQQVASRYDLSWRMLAAQGYVESGFDSTAVGRQGSMGIMQIHPDTWQEWSPYVDAADPFDTYGNVLVAALYLDYLRTTLAKEGHSEVEWMLAAYNWGPDKVLTIMAEDGSWTDLPLEVQQYAADVLRIAQSIPGN